MKTNLLHIVQNMECTKEDKKSLFGPFSTEPSQIMLLPDTRDQIKILVKHVKKTIETKGFEYFTDCEAVTEYNYSVNVTQSALGPLFRDIQKHQFSGRDSVQSNDKEYTHMDDNVISDTSKPSSASHRLLSKLKATADQNVSRKKAGYRFPNDLKSLAVYVRINGGKMVYETIQKNLELALPSLDTTNRIIRKMKNPIVEGNLRANELLEYLMDRELPLVVTLSEDATGIEGRVQYDPKTNQVTGFTLPLAANGMPIPLAYPARSGIEIVSHFNNNNTVWHDMSLSSWQNHWQIFQHSH